MQTMEEHAVEERIDGLEEEIDIRFDAVDQRLDRVEADVRELRGDIKSMQRLMLYGFISLAVLIVTSATLQLS